MLWILAAFDQTCRKANIKGKGMSIFQRVLQRLPVPMTKKISVMRSDGQNQNQYNGNQNGSNSQGNGQNDDYPN